MTKLDKFIKRQQVTSDEESALRQCEEVCKASCSTYTGPLHSLRVFYRCNGGNCSLLKAGPETIDHCRDYLNDRLRRVLGGSLNDSPYYYYHATR